MIKETVKAIMFGMLTAITVCAALVAAYAVISL